MGHYCRVCEKNRPNEKFSGKGHRNHICKVCSRQPKEIRERVDDLEEIFKFWRQTNISKLNLERLLELSKSACPKISSAAKVLYDVGSLFPFKKKRVGRIAKKEPSLIPRMESVGFIDRLDFDDCSETIEGSMGVDVDSDLWDEYCEMEMR